MTTHTPGTTIVINDVTTPQDLFIALGQVMQVFTDPESFEREFQVFDPAIKRPGPVPALAEPAPYLPCSKRGTHLRLTECWMCWSDVHRGAALETDVLCDAAWDLPVGRPVPVVTRAPQRWVDVPLFEHISDLEEPEQTVAPVVIDGRKPGPLTAAGGNAAA